MNMRVMDLKPGYVIEAAGMLATFIVQSRHPLHPGLQLVVWRMHSTGEYSFDCLSVSQVVGKLVKGSTKEQLEWALGLGGK
jgi:hypothetical protein